MSSYLPFNVNHYVKVKLTPAGRAALRKEHDTLFADWPVDRKPEYRDPDVDPDGWSRFQLWDLMHRIGRACFMGGPVPFETTILVEQAATSTASQVGTDGREATGSEPKTTPAEQVGGKPTQPETGEPS